MSAFLKRYRLFAAALVGLLACSAGFQAWTVGVRTDPLNDRISLSPPCAIDREIQIRRDTPQILELAFSIGPRPRDEMRNLVGEYGPPGSDGRLQTRSGVNVPLQWSLNDSMGRIVASGRGDTYGRYAVSDTEFWRPVAAPIHVPPGHYRFKAEVMSDVPQFREISVRLRLGVSGGKFRNDWKSDAIFWGSLIDFVILRPLCVLLAVFLIVQGMAAGMVWFQRRDR